MRAYRFAFLALSLAAACTAENPEVDADLLDLDESDDAEAVSADGKADSLHTTSTYYVARRDTRRCVAPLCGGYWVHRVNFANTRCDDGGWASECYVADLDLGALGFDDELDSQVSNGFGAGQAVLRGSIRRAAIGRHRLGQFVATEAHRAASEAPVDGVFYSVRDKGLRCITFPCFSMHEAKLNSTTSRAISGLDLEGVGASEADVATAHGLLSTGILVAGTNVRKLREGPAGTGVTLVAEQFYLPFVSEPVVRHCGGFAGATCNDGEFCNYEAGEYCGAADAMGTCETIPDVCPRIFRPVCGCDNRTYGNECEANAAGVGILSEGECAAPPGDCRSAGCGEGQSCQYCWGSFACIPEGALC